MDVHADLVEFLRDEEVNAFFPTLLRLVAGGEPVPLSRLAAAAGVAEDRVAGWLHAQPGTDWDQEGRLLGFGLTQRRTPHRFVVGGRELFTFCAADTLLFPPILGLPARVESTCPATGVPIRLDIRPEAVDSVDPITTVVSHLGLCAGLDVRATTCDHGHFFATDAAAGNWRVEHPDGEVLAVDEFFKLGLAADRELGWIAR